MEPYVGCMKNPQHLPPRSTRPKSHPRATLPKTATSNKPITKSCVAEARKLADLCSLSWRLTASSFDKEYSAPSSNFQRAPPKRFRRARCAALKQSIFKHLTLQTSCNCNKSQKIEIPRGRASALIMAQVYRVASTHRTFSTATYLQE